MSQTSRGSMVNNFLNSDKKILFPKQLTALLKLVSTSLAFPGNANCLISNLGHTDVSFTVTFGCIEGYYETEIHGYTTVSFREGEGLPNL
jgi:hypothetical protein